jgi:hypothetical protein
LTTPDWVGLGDNEPKRGRDEEKRKEATEEGEDKIRRNF